MDPYTPAEQRRIKMWRRIDAATDRGAGWSIYVPKPSPQLCSVTKQHRPTGQKGSHDHY